MTFDATGESVRYSGTIGDDRPADVAINSDGSRIYTSSSDGNLRVYDADTGQLLQTINVGNNLGAIDVSPDDSFLIAAELIPVAVHPEGGGYPTYTVAVYKVDLATGAVTQFNYEASYDNYTFKDVAVLADGNVLLFQAQPPGWSSWSQLRTLDLDTGTFSTVADSPSISAGSFLQPGQDGTHVLVADYNISDAGLQMYESGTGVIADHSLYADNVSGFNWGIQAFSEEGDLVAQYVYGNGLHIYNEALEYQVNLFDTHPEWQSGAVSGLAFDSNGQYLFVLDNETNTIVQLSTSDWSTVATYDVGADVGGWSGGDYGNRLIVGPDMRYFTVVTDLGFVEVNNPSVSSTITGTSGPDDLTGTGLFDEITGDGGDDTIHGLGGNDILAGGDGNDVIHGDAGDDRLDGGPGNDQLDGGAGSDTADYRAATAAVIVDLSLATAQNTGGAGTDTLISIENLDGTAFNDALTGNSEANRLTGGAGNDMLSGGDGDDEINGGAGNDSLNGGAGADSVSYFGSSAGVTVSLAIAGPQNTGGSGTDTLSSFTNLRGSNFNDVLTGAATSNKLLGEGGNDVISSGGGNDTIDGGTGSDAMSGGAGNDRYFVDNNGDTAVEASAEGTDEVRSSVSFTLGANVENLLLVGTGAINGIGNALDNFIYGNRSANAISGADGADDLRGYDGDDVLNGGTGADSLLGGNGFDILTGGAGADVLDGGQGRDLYLLNSAAELTGDVIADSGDFYGVDELRYVSSASATLTLSAMTGIDRISIGTGTDLVADSSGTNAVNIDARAVGSSLNIWGNDGANVIQAGDGYDSLDGGGGNDRLIGNGGGDLLYGGLGVDVMLGGTGDDIYYVDNTGDFYSENAGEGTDLVFSSISLALRANIENLTLIGSSSIYGKGNDLANAIEGNSGSNSLYGLAGDDSLVGGDGNDRLDGGSGADRMEGGFGNDSYVVDNVGDSVLEEQPNQGTDLVYASVSYSLRTYFENLTLTGTADLIGKGNSEDNILKGNSGANRLYGLDAIDRLYGNAGSDILDGGTGNDILSGGADDDYLYGRQDADTLKGDNGNDWLEGGASRDVLYGGAGSDSFVFREGDFAGLTSSTCDQVKDFSQADQDHVRLSFIDADATLSGDQAFTFVGTNAFSGTAGELRYEEINGNTYVTGDTNGDGTADFMIRLDGLHALTAADFVL